jgi:hypothetical protein
MWRIRLPATGNSPLSTLGVLRPSANVGDQQCQPKGLIGIYPTIPGGYSGCQSPDRGLGPIAER